MMNKIGKLFIVSLAGLMLTNCKNDDNSGGVLQAKSYAEVYPVDIQKIEEYLATHYVTVTRNANNDVTGVVLGEIGTGTQTPIIDEPLLAFKTVKLHDLEYKVYYLKLNEGLPVDIVNYDNGGKHPCGVDNVIASYHGYLLNGTEFDFSATHETFNLLKVVRGWEYIFPEFRSGATTINGQGMLTSQNYGSGIMFLPSGLSYFNQVKAKIPAYSPLIFTFNLYGVVHTDLDNDKILSRFEYGFDADGKYVDTDGDKFPDFADKDDDNDTHLTLDEIKYTDMSGTHYYEFANIPLCTDGKKRHLSNVCHE